MKYSAILALAGLFVLFVSCDKTTSTIPAVVADDGTVVLAKRHFLPPAGTTESKEMNMQMPDADLIVMAGGNEIKGIMNRSSLKKETVEVLSQDKVRRLLVSEENTGEMKLNGQVQPNPDKPDALLAVAVILQRKDGAWTARLENGDVPNPDQKKRLDKMTVEANRDSDFEMYGDTPRKPGDKWKVDPAKVLGLLYANNLTGSYTVRAAA